MKSSLGNAQPQESAKAKQPKRRIPRPSDDEMQEEGIDPDRLPLDFWEQAQKFGLLDDQSRAENAELIDARTGEVHGGDVVPPDLSGETVPPPKPIKPYAPPGWRMKPRVEFDITLPADPLCRIFRLERDDLIRMNVQEYLDTFSPLLLEDALSPEEQSSR